MRRAQGATLVELVITIVIISIAIAGVVGAFSLISGRSADPLNETRAVALAQLYMDEILMRKYDEQTPQGGVPRYSGACSIGVDGAETRPTFDDVDDYHGLNDAPPASALSNLTGYNGFAVQVSVSCAGAEVGLPASQAKRIDLVVTAPDNRDFVFSAYKANF
ncbi:prepilin-type N-terminal cleavage/methylation domain-containing protein [Marinobacter salinisoli]|uniref:Prepilin-type N-terminal cleavage/methylation domain-containing protein n=1 Tax=Marinobacter salinisoli TaxID=2769486 RepID=A0ABX7MX59_9GAMM|nr:prepilin-type N-terminal cleavage/methylation domain-containing protein [Marinobacter salinisoli]QSP96035.1 prepilin-type N-terminal cleavage/methylation domain-containing protein [Marinobacter salinisoli]